MSRPFPKPPDKPDEWECCKRGCCPCIFDYYYDAMDRWRDRVIAMGGDPDAQLAALGREP
ncbi:MAG: oxidoreductase-like domain-containing protein [Pseudomonadota bacterium]